MIKNYFIIALRNIRRYTAHSILNISGMTIGMACAFLILLWVQHEWSYDRHFENADNLYRVLVNHHQEGGDKVQGALTPNALALVLKEEYPEIIRSSRFESRAMPIKKGNESIIEVSAFVDKDFLEMFNIGFVRGDRKSALAGSYNMVLTEEMAHKYFGDEDPLGKTLTSMNFVFTVTGIVQCLPKNSHISFDCLVPFELFAVMGADLNAWNFATYTYIELREGTNDQLVDNQIRSILKRKFKGARAELFLQNIKKIHLFSHGKYAADISGHGDITYIRMLSIIAVFILFIACINFMNFSTAQSVRRAREIGIRKVAGSSKRKIAFQFLGESLLIVFVAHIIAMILVELLLPDFNNLIRNYQSNDFLMMNFNNHIAKQVDVNYKSAGLYIGLIAIVVFCGLLAGSYPALYLSSLKPMDTIKGIVNKNPGNAKFRRILVIFQFTLSVLLIICTLIVETQFNFMKNKNIGFNKDNIGYFQFGMEMQREILKKDLSNNPDIVSVTIADNPFNDLSNRALGDFSWEGKLESNNVLFHLLPVDKDYAKTFQLDLKKGRFFSSEFSTDNTAAVINEKAAEVLGFKEPLGEILSSSDGSKFRIIGVVKDFHFQSLHTKIDPLVMFMYTGGFNCFIRMKPDKITSTIDFVKKTFKSYNPPYPMEFKFFDEDYNNLYWSEQRMGKIFGYFSFLAIIISCLGLIGLSSFMIERKTKEIGIRKVNGAKSFEIFSLLSKDYLLSVLISIIIACPIAWYAMNKWLQNFAYRINMSWWVFALAGAIVLLIALLTVSVQSYKAANKNPVEALRYE